jgi:magnesium-protoporphyrin O-methyltransferase
MASEGSTGPRGGFCCDADLDRIGCDGRGWESDLARLRELGPRDETAELLAAVLREDVAGSTVIDVGAGVGAVHLALLEAGAARAIDVDASKEYLAAARAEADLRGLADRVEYRHGDVVELAPSLPPADVVVADSVVCCYPFVDRLIKAFVTSGPRVVALSYVNERWWLRAAMHVMNGLWTIRRRPDRWYIHRHATVDRLMRGAGYEVIHDGGPWYWRVVVYRRVSAS